MMYLSRITLAVALAAGVATTASAQIVSQDVSFEIESMTVMTLGSAPATAVIRRPVTLSDSAAVVASGVMADTVYSSYNFYSNDIASKTITAHISAGTVPTNTSLFVYLAPPPGATSATLGNLSSTPRTVVSDIGATYGSGLQILYQFAASSAAAPTTGTVTVTYTVSADI